MAVSLPDIYLPKPKVMLTESSTEQSISSNDGSLMFGLVVAQYETCNHTMTEAPVLFNPRGALIIKQGTTTYYIVNESEIYFREAEYIPAP
jgi:hypothetical protein